jgi:hypothetical protein
MQALLLTLVLDGDRAALYHGQNPRSLLGKRQVGFMVWVWYTGIYGPISSTGLKTSKYTLRKITEKEFVK